MVSGPVSAILSAALFGVSPALAKLIVGEISPVLLAGLLYLGSGIGLGLVLFYKKINPFQELKTLSRTALLKLVGAVFTGGVLAPVFLVYGIKYASAFEASLLLNLETVTTTLLAWLIFKEHIGLRVWISKAFLLVGAAIITLSPTNGFVFSLPAFYIIGACMFWGFDNNFTRDLETLSPMTLAAIKGLTAGAFNCILALSLGQGSASHIPIIGSLAIGMFSYGFSLVLFINALRSIGSSRTSTYFATGPFFGMLFSIIILGEQPLSLYWISAVVMAIGIFVLYRESHSHIHTHETVTHSHAHLHDEHHQHSHDGSQNSEPHEHLHTHEPITHSHVHWPDLHHRHKH